VTLTGVGIRFFQIYPQLYAESQSRAKGNTVERASFGDFQGAESSKDLCEWERFPDPCILVNFGASGDLTARKLIPALYRLFLAGELPTPFCILGTGRTALTDTAFRSKMNQALIEAGTDLEKWDDFECLLYYQPVAYDNSESYRALHSRLFELEKKYHTRNRIFYLAIPPL
jgi:glucose-6-phosphate 1-dehydrogenase